MLKHVQELCQILGLTQPVEQNHYQDDFTVRTPGDKVRNGPGNFTDDAKEHYDQEVTELANSHHKYNITI